MIVATDMLVPKERLLRKVDKVMDYDWIHERLEPCYSNKMGRLSIDPVVLIQHLFGIP